MCIDQRSNTERSAQVAMMGEIYQIASRVYIWLGVHTKKDEKLFRLLRYVTPLAKSDEFGPTSAGNSQ